MILPDLLGPNLEVVFCGTAPGNKSAARQAYYAGAGNLFYPTLSSCEFTPRILKPHQFPELLLYKIGLTDLAKFSHGMDKDLKANDFDVGGFTGKIEVHQPKLICFNGKEAAKVFLGLKNTKMVEYGLQNVKIGKTKIYVAPSTSLQAIAYWDESIWQSIKDHI
jgi:double-stranded uracil-DNA glycosylase